MSKTVTFTRKEYLGLQRAYLKAIKEDVKSFVFEGNEYHVSYAKYLLEYLDSNFQPKKK